MWETLLRVAALYIIMSIRLIPRVRVNYTLSDLLKSLFVSEKGQTSCRECEKIISAYFDGEYTCLTPSGRDAIYEVLVRLPQKKVIVPAYTCMAVVEAVLLAKKDIVYCNTDAATYNSSYIEDITPESIVLATHQYGLPCNIEEIAKKCKETGAVLVEDCATSMGSTVNGKKTGTFGDYAIVSFNSSKLLNVPPVGGVLVSKDEEMIEKIKKEAEWKPSSLSFKCKAMVRGLAYVFTKNAIIYKLFHYFTIDSKGKLQKTEHEKPAENKTDLYSYRFAEWQAVILLKQLKRLEDHFRKRKELFAYYDKALTNPIVKKPIVDNNAVCCRYAIQVKNRIAFYKDCVQHGVDMDFSHCSLGCPAAFATEHQMAKEILNLPFYFNLSEIEIRKVVKVINTIQ